MLPLDRKAVLIAMGRAGTLTPELATLVRTHADDTVRWKLIEAKQPPAVLEAAGLPITQITFQRRRPGDEFIQKQVSVHLDALGLDPVAFDFTHPHLAERIDLSERWEANFRDVHCQWALHLFHHRVARIMALADHPAFTPLVKLIERGIHPFGLSRDEAVFWVVDPKADHNAGIRAWDAAVLTSETLDS